MICTNPDLIVHEEKRRVLCGKIAEVFESLGGKLYILVNHTRGLQNVFW